MRCRRFMVDIQPESGGFSTTILPLLLEARPCAWKSGTEIVAGKRHGDFITLGGKFPRLTKKTAEARLKEIKKLLLAI